MDEFLAIDIGGTTLKYALVRADGSIQPLGSLPTGAAMTRAELAQSLHKILNDPQTRSIRGIGISSLGIVDPQRGMVCTGVENLPALQGFCPRSFFDEAGFAQPVCIVNDASAAALGEHWLGAAQGLDNFLCVAFGTGIGGGLVLNGRPWNGSSFCAGELGYWDYLDDRHYWELEDSAIALIRKAQTQSGCPDLTGEAFFERLRLQDPLCCDLFESWAQKAGRIFANITLLLDLQAILVGGGISAQKEILTPALQACMDRCLPPHSRGRCKVSSALLGNRAALLGAVRPLLP